MSTLDKESLAANSGVGNKTRPGEYPIYVQAENEKSIANENTGCRVTLGSDREHTIASGFGGEGRPQCGTVRMTAGPMGSLARSADEDGNLLYVNPHNEFDAATFYVSARSKVDESFNLVPPPVSGKFEGSCVVAKGDGVRIVGRDGGVNIVSGRGDRIGSKGQEIVGKGKINLIIDNDPSAGQPIPRGDNLKEALIEMNTKIQDLLNLVSGFMAAQMSFNSVITNHTHPVPNMIVMGPQPPAPAPVVIGSTIIGTTTMSPEVTAAGAVCAGLQAPQKACTPLTAANTTGMSLNYFSNPASFTHMNSRHVSAG